MFEYKFHISAKCVWWTVVHLVVAAVAGWAIYMRYDGSLFFAWYLSSIVAAILLMLLSIPRRVVVDDRRMAIHSVLDVTLIDRDAIVSVQRVPSSKVRWVVPLFAGCGFFGYYGLFFDIRHLNIFKFYGGEWRHLVEIVDIYDDTYYISCREGDRLVAELATR